MSPTLFPTYKKVRVWLGKPGHGSNQTITAVLVRDVCHVWVMCRVESVACVADPLPWSGAHDRPGVGQPRLHDAVQGALLQGYGALCLPLHAATVPASSSWSFARAHACRYLLISLFTAHVGGSTPSGSAVENAICLSLSSMLSLALCAGGRIRDRIPSWTDRILFHTIPSKHGRLLPEPMPTTADMPDVSLTDVWGGGWGRRGPF